MATLVTRPADTSLASIPYQLLQVQKGKKTLSHNGVVCVICWRSGAKWPTPEPSSTFKPPWGGWKPSRATGRRFPLAPLGTTKFKNIFIIPSKFDSSRRINQVLISACAMTSVEGADAWEKIDSGGCGIVPTSWWRCDRVRNRTRRIGLFLVA